MCFGEFLPASSCAVPQHLWTNSKSSWSEIPVCLAQRQLHVFKSRQCQWNGEKPKTLACVCVSLSSTVSDSEPCVYTCTVYAPCINSACWKKQRRNVAFPMPLSRSYTHQYLEIALGGMICKAPLPPSVIRTSQYFPTIVTAWSAYHIIYCDAKFGNLILSVSTLPCSYFTDVTVVLFA